MQRQGEEQVKALQESDLEDLDFIGKERELCVDPGTRREITAVSWLRTTLASPPNQGEGGLNSSAQTVALTAQTGSTKADGWMDGCTEYIKNLKRKQMN